MSLNIPAELLPWHYALSAFWVGQAGSLLFWAWSVGVLAMIYRFWPRRTASPLREPAFAILMAYQCFLVAIMVFGADPMQPSLVVPREGGGLSPLLQHPAMLLHPPVVFLGYAGCAIPFALAAAALLSGRLDAAWIRDARPWAFFAWTVLGIGILVGAYWAYEELGWGGYWNWDPVENGSLIPWLTATAMIHAAMVYRQRGALKRTTIVAGGGDICSLQFRRVPHAKRHLQQLARLQPIADRLDVPAVDGGVDCGRGSPSRAMPRCYGAREPGFRPVGQGGRCHRVGLRIDPPGGGGILRHREPAGVTGLLPPQGPRGAGFYNGVLIPTGLLLLAAMAAAPLLRWGAPPETKQVKALLLAAGAGVIAAGLAWFGGLRHPLAMAVVGLAAMTAIALAASWVLDARRHCSTMFLRDLLLVLRNRRRTYAGYVMHLGLACLAVGVAGSSLGTQQHEATLGKGESIRWAGRDIRFIGVLQRRFPEKLVVQAELEVTADGAAPYTLRPAQEYYFLQNEWSTEVAIHSTWSGDFYTILHSGEGQDRIRLTLVENPMMRWMWLAGWMMAAGAVPWFWPAGKRWPPKQAADPAVQLRGRPKLAVGLRRSETSEFESD